MAEFSSYPAGTPCWIDLATTDFDGARTFYATLFDWTYDEGSPETGNYSLVRLRGKAVAGLYPLSDDMLAQGIPPTWTTYLSTDDIDATVARATKAGADVLVAPMQVMDEGSMAVIRDPSGAVVGLWQPGKHIGAQLANEAGTFTWSELMSRDLDAARRFYTDVFGYGTDEMDMGGGPPYVVIKVGDHEVGGLMAMPDTMPATVPSHWTTYFAVDNADDAVATVDKAGGSVLNGPVDSPYGRWALVADPVGATFMVIRPPQGD